MSQTEERDPPQSAEGAAAHHAEQHPEVRDYVRIAVILAVVTAIEVALYYVEPPDPILIGLLLGIMVIKFVLVINWFMHLKFDNPGLKRLFWAGLVLAVSVYSVVLFMFGVLLPRWNP